MLGFRKRHTDNPRLDQIRKLGLFGTLNQKELRVVDGLLHERRYLSGEIVFDQGEEAQALYIVLSGRVLICDQGDPVKGRVVYEPVSIVPRTLVPKVIRDDNRYQPDLKDQGNA